jgi:hypothetical protein
MRKSPDFTAANSANYFTIYIVGATYNYATVTLDFAGLDAANIILTTTGFTPGQSGWVGTNNTSAYIDFSAEL